MRPRINQDLVKTRCYACDKLRSRRNRIFTSDGQMQYVGAECFKKIRKAGQAGYQPPLGGPRLFFQMPQK